MASKAREPDANEPDPVLAAIIDRLIVPGHLLRRYHSITRNLEWARTSDAIRAELARGRVMRENREGGSYITVHVPGRFRLDIEHEVGTEGLIAVDLRPAKRRNVDRRRKQTGHAGPRRSEQRVPRRSRRRGGGNEGRKAA
jgi:hypothetical protein